MSHPTFTQALCRRLNMVGIVASALFVLVLVDSLMLVYRRRALRLLLDAVANPTSAPQNPELIETLCRGITHARVLYFKPVRCLQLSLASVLLLRLHGIASELVIGLRPTPFMAHAWVEAGGSIVMNSRVQNLEQCRVILRA